MGAKEEHLRQLTSYPGDRQRATFAMKYILLSLSMAPWLVGLVGLTAIGAIGMRSAIAERKYDAELRRAHGTLATLRLLFSAPADWERRVDSRFHRTIRRRRKAAHQMLVIGAMVFVLQILLVLAVPLVVRTF